MLAFDEIDLFLWAEQSGFADVVVELRLATHSTPPLGARGWEAFLASSPNPQAPTFGKALRQALDDEEFSRLQAHLRPLVEAGRGARWRDAATYLTARKPDDRA